MMSRTIPWAALVAMSFASCARNAGHYVPPPVAPDGPERSEVETILTSALHWTHPTEGDINLQTNRITGQGEQGSRAKVILLTKHDSAPPYRRAWVDSLITMGVITGACYAKYPRDCADSTMSSFLRLSEPIIRGDSAFVDVDDEGENPRACRSPDHESFVGFSTHEMVFYRDGAQWRVTDVRPGLSGSGVCGHPPPKEAARRRKLARIDSIVTHTPSQIAGTYRFVVANPQGDSAVLFSRTARFPRNASAERGEADIVRERQSNAGPPTYTGYDITAVCSLHVADLPQHRGSFNPKVDDCYHTVTLAPVITARDSTVWRGWSEMEVEVYLRFRSTLGGARLNQASDLADDDSTWTFYPGFWIRSSNGRVRFRQTFTHSGDTVLTITGERISLTTLSDTTRY